MRFQANENFPANAVEALRHQGHDVTWIRTDAPGISDAEVLTRAQSDDRILLTFDKDFGEERISFTFACNLRDYLISD